MTKGIIGYTDPLSVAPAETLRGYVSCDANVSSFNAEIVRMVSYDPNPLGPGIKSERVSSLGEHEGLFQPVYPGSHALIDDHPLLSGLTDFTLQANVFPTLPGNGDQVVLSRYTGDAQRGFALLIDSEGRPALALGNESLVLDARLEARRWYTIAATYQSNSGEVTIHCNPLNDAGPDTGLSSEVFNAPAGNTGDPNTPFVIAAQVKNKSGERLVTEKHFNGRIERPAIAGRALSPSEIAALATGHLPDGAVAAWDFSIGIDTYTITDVSANGLHGQLFNLPMRGVCGSNWSNSTLSAAPEEYGAIHFLEDGLEDCRWQPSVEWTVPTDLKSGFYAVHVQSRDHEDFIPFFVRPSPDKPRAKCLLLASTGTYLAYGNSRFWWEQPTQEMLLNRYLEYGLEDRYLIEHPELGPSVYDQHKDGTDVCYVSRLRPNLFMRPGHRRWEGYPSDLYLTDWLETQGTAYDVITDEDLDRDGLPSLEPYQVVLSSTHPEYISTRMWDALHDYTHTGGRLMMLGGNIYSFLVAYHPERPWIMECRKSELWKSRYANRAGENEMSTTGERGGNPWVSGRSSDKLVGVSTSAQGFDHSTYYRRRPDSFNPRARFIFEGIGDDEVIGNFGLRGGAVGQEWDNTSGRFRRDLPSNQLVLAASEDHTEHTGKYGLIKEDYTAEMVFFETGVDGAVFSISSMAWCAALSHNDYDNNVSRITGNVLGRFLDPALFSGGANPGQC